MPEMGSALASGNVSVMSKPMSPFAMIHELFPWSLSADPKATRVRLRKTIAALRSKLFS
jgi:hypothetical protein